MTHPNLERLRHYASSWIMGDGAGALAFLAPEVVMHVPGRNAVSGDYHGVKGLREYAERLRVALGEGGTFAVKAFHDLLATDDHAVALVHEHASRPAAGKTIDLHRAVVYDLRDGMIAEIWIHETDQYAFDEFLTG